VAIAGCDQATPPTSPRPSALDVGSPLVPYEVIDLGKLSGMTIALATAINNRGQILGFSENARGLSRAFLWQDGVMQDLGTLGGLVFPTDINENGQVVGRSSILGWWYPFLWSDGVMTNLDPGRRMDNPSAVPHINDAGQVAWTGDSLVNPHLIIHHAFLWSNGVVTDLVVGRPSAVAGINERGEIAGNTLDSGQAFAWRNGTLQFLPSLGGVASPTAINNRGQVVGTAITPSSATIAHAVLWDHGEITDLGVLPGDSLSSGGFITESGKVAGMSYNDRFAGGHPFLWRSGVLLPMSPTYLTDPLLFQLVGVNQRGTAAGNLRSSGGAVVLEDGVTWTLPTLEGGIGTSAAAINARGDVVGFVTMPSPILGQSDLRAVLWRRINPTVAGLPSP
jgi:probable HAF family extracellular repeat protein